VRAEDVACWLVKTAAPPARLAPGWSPGELRTMRRCVRRSSRLGLMHAGQPCVLWLSGRHEPGVHALGRLVTAAEQPQAPAAQPEVTVALRLLPRPVARADLLQVPAFAGAEVIRMAAGSNPSYLTTEQLAALVSAVGDDLPVDWR
jgi:hypothetical protein